jgi:hypothetical protein
MAIRQRRAAILFVLLSLLTLACPAGASWLFDLTDTVSVADSANLTLPNGDWTVAGWVKTSGTSSSWRTFVSWGAGDQSFSMAFRQSTLWPANSLNLGYRGSYAESISTYGGTTPGDEADWVYVVACRDGNAMKGYTWENGTAYSSNENGSFSYQYGCNAAEAWVFGGTYFAGRMAEWAKWDRLLSAGERAALYAGGKAEEASGGVPVWQFDMFDDYDARYGGLTATNNGTINDQTEHPIDRGAAAPLPVTNVWPAGGEVINYQTQIIWSRTPSDTLFEQTFTVYCDKSNPPTTEIATDTEDLMVNSGALDDGATYYLRIDTKATVGGLTATGAVVSFTTEAAPNHLYYVGVAATGTGLGTDESNLKAWSGVAATESDAVIRLSGSSTTMFYEYESASPSSYTEWPDRIYEARTVVEYGITRNFQDWRRVGRFIDGSYWVVGTAANPTYICSYSPARSLDGSGWVKNGMMVNPIGTRTGLDQQNNSGVYEAAFFSATVDLGDDIPYPVYGTATYPKSVLNCVSTAVTDAEYLYDSNHRCTMKAVSVLTVVSVAMANNTYFRPSYRNYEGNAVQYQWSDVVTARIPQVDLACSYQLLSSAGETRNTTTGKFTSLERTVSRPSMELVPGWLNVRCHAFHQSYFYGSQWAQENGNAYLACYDNSLGTITAKKRLIIGCIQRGIDFYGIYKQGYSTWWEADGGCNQGRYWPILFAGIVLDDAAMMNIGIESHQDVDNNWTLDGGFEFHENVQTFELTADFLGTGLPAWDTTPWKVNTYLSVIDNTGTVYVVNGSATVTGANGETWGGATAGHKFMTTQTVDGVLRCLDAVRGASTTAVAYTIGTVYVGSPSTLTLTSVYQGANASGASFVIDDEIYLGNFYKYGNFEGDEFTSANEGQGWWSEKPTTLSGLYSSWKWAMTSSTYQGGGNYMGGFTSGQMGLALAPVIMNENGGYPAVALYNSPQFFNYFDGRITALGVGDWGAYTDAWPRTLMQTEWVYPTTDWEAPSGTKATDPSPADFASDVAVSATLSWTAGTGAVKHNVYLDTHTGVMELVGSAQTETTFDPTLANDTTYYWRVNELDTNGNEIAGAGTMWNFTTAEIPPPTDATNPSPANLTTAQKRTGTSVVLSWTAGDGTPTHDVWFGTSVSGMTQRAAGQAGTTYTVSGLSANTTYYWRIDEVSGEVTAEGDVWIFTTRPARMLFRQ